MTDSLIMVEKSAYSEWTKLFDEDLSKIWFQERKELQRAAMLMEALQKELRIVSRNLDKEISSLRSKLSVRDKLRTFTNIPIDLLEIEEKENVTNVESVNKLRDDYSDMQSPDLFNNIMNITPSTQTNSRSSVDDDDITEIGSSPTINKSRKFIKKKKMDASKIMSAKKDKHKVKKNIFEGTEAADNDDTVIDCTPQTSSRVHSRTSYLDKRKNRKKMTDNTTLTQIFSKSNLEEQEKNKSKSADELKEMGVTDILDFINGESIAQNDSCNDSTYVLDAFSKGGFLEDSDIISPKKAKILFSPEPIVRGHARKHELKGFSCRECEAFYANMKLSPEELKKKINECSKHRYKYQPPEETMPGFWDLTFSSQVKEVRK